MAVSLSAKHRTIRPRHGTEIVLIFQNRGCVVPLFPKNRDWRAFFGKED
jgi:hypothetical protein